MAADLVRTHVIVRGDVQGVGFRWSTRARAQADGLDGYVRNLPDGSVEVDAQGDRAAVDALVEWLHAGPPGSRVDDVEVTTLEADAASGAGFDIRR